MPIYEYYCETCREEISIRFSSVLQAAAQTAACPACGGENLTRLISRVAFARSRPAAAPRSGDPTPSTSGQRDESPRALAQAMRAASAGRDMGQEFQEVAGRLEKGEPAPAIEASLRKRVGEDMQAH